MSKTKEQVLLRQVKDYGCGLYSVANACDMPEFVTNDRIEVSRESGNSITQLTNWMREDDLNWAINVIHYDSFSTKIPDGVWDYVENFNEKVLSYPLLLELKVRERHSKNHMMGLRIYPDKSLRVFDSLKTEPFGCTKEELKSLYYEFYGLYNIDHLETGNMICFT